VECQGSTVVDCIWSDGFSAWSGCPITCGEGVQSRHRQVLHAAQNGGKDCEGDGEQLRKCGERPCPGAPVQDSSLCLWSSWGEWGACSSTCGKGVQERFRVFLVGQHGREGRSLDEDKCMGGSHDTRSCTRSNCPAAECCDQVAVKSSGPAAYEQELYIGKYQRLSEGYNGHPAYSKNTPRPLFIYFFTGKKENQWAIGPVLGQRQASMRNSGSGACVDSPGDEWMYATSDDNWRDNDHTLIVECDDAHDAVIDDLELNRTRLTIGLTTVHRNSKHNANEKMKHKEMDIAADSRDILTMNMIKKDKNKGIIANSAENYGKKVDKKDKKVKFSKEIKKHIY